MVCDTVWSGINMFPSHFYPTASHWLTRRTASFPPAPRGLFYNLEDGGSKYLRSA